MFIVQFILYFRQQVFSFFMFFRWVFTTRFISLYLPGSLILCRIPFAIKFPAIFLEAYSEACQTSKMELFAKTINGWKSLTIFAKISILDVWQGSEYTSVFSKGWGQGRGKKIFEQKGGIGNWFFFQYQQNVITVGYWFSN